MLLEEATEAGLLGASPFFSPRALSRPFSGGEWAGLTRGVAGSCETEESIGTPQSRESSLQLLLQAGAGGSVRRHHPLNPHRAAGRGADQAHPNSPHWRRRPPGHRSCHHRCPEIHSELNPARRCQTPGQGQPPDPNPPPAAGRRSPTPRWGRSYPNPTFLQSKPCPNTRRAPPQLSVPPGHRSSLSLTYRLMLSFSSAFRFLESML